MSNELSLYLLVLDVIRKNPGMDSTFIHKQITAGGYNTTLNNISSCLANLSHKGKVARGKDRLPGMAKTSWLYYINDEVKHRPTPKTVPLPLEHKEAEQPKVKAKASDSKLLDIQIVLPVNDRETIVLTVEQLRHLRDQLNAVPI